MIDVPTTPDHDKNYAKSNGGDSACIVCGRNTRHPAGYLRFDMSDLNTALTAEEYSKAGEPAEFPIGADCLKNNPELSDYLI